MFAPLPSGLATRVVSYGVALSFRLLAFVQLFTTSFQLVKQDVSISSFAWFPNKNASSVSEGEGSIPSGRIYLWWFV